MKYFDDHPIIKRIFCTIGIVFIILIILSGIVITYVWNKLGKIDYADQHEVSADVTLQTEEYSFIEPTTDHDTAVTESEIEGTIDALPESADSSEVIEEVINILLIGTDERTQDYIENARSDSMILVSINKELHTVRLISLERGIGVPVLEGHLKGQYDLLTHIYRWGGADLLLETVRQCFELDVDHYVHLNFASFEKIVDAVGGIDMYLESREVPEVQGWPEDSGKYGNAGTYRLNGRMALNYARLRSIDSDWKRVVRQRKVILAVVEELKDASLLELNDLTNVVLPLIETNLSQLEVAELMLYGPTFLNSEFDHITVPKKGTYSGYVKNGQGFAVDFELNNDLIRRFLYEGVSSEDLLAE